MSFISPLLLGAVTALAGGAVAYLLGMPSAAAIIWTAGLWIAGAPVVWKTGRGVLRGVFAADLLAAFAIIGAVLLGQPVAGLVIVAMQTGGEALERYAAGRASRALRELEAAAPRIAHRDASGEFLDVPVEDVVVGDRLLIRPGEMIPCDAEVLSGRSHVDTSPLTGEPIPRIAEPGIALMSGMLNGEGVLTVRATARAGESQYARIIELVRSAQASRAPLQRLADRYAVWFTPITLAICGVTYLATHDATRVLSVLVVATPCPLILATPIALMGGVNRAARRQIIVRSGAALERLASVTTAVFDKTGTLTVGRPDVADVEPVAGWNREDVLLFAASLEQVSSHLLARSVVERASRDRMSLLPASSVVEAAGRGLAGRVGEHDVAVGSAAYIRLVLSCRRMPASTGATQVPGPPDGSATDHAILDAPGDALRAYIAIDGRVAGVIHFADQPRPHLPGLLQRLRGLGIRRTMLLTGDRAASAKAVARLAGIDDVRADLLPGDKVTAIRALVGAGERVLMVGDGTNDAPALSSATVGVALAGHPGGGGITTEAADVVILVDDVSRVADAVAIGRDTMRIARQSIWIGLGASGLAIVAAAAGHVTPVAGALLQEAIDVGVILNALRAVREPPASRASIAGITSAPISPEVT